MREVAPVSVPGQLRDHALDRAAGRELHDDERDQHDPEQGRDHEQDAADDIGGHRHVRLVSRVARLDPSAARSSFAALSGSYHQVSGMPRA